MKTPEENNLLTRLRELVAIGKKKKGVLEYKEITDYLGDIELDACLLYTSQVKRLWTGFPRMGLNTANKASGLLTGLKRTAGGLTLHGK